MTVLGIESSCDETSAAVVVDGTTILSNVVATQIPFHEEYRGVVPEIASRKHTEWILPVVKQALGEADCILDRIDGIAATNRPGLMGSLLVGLTFGKTLAWATGKPFVAVNHMLAHLYAAHLHTDITYPYLGLLVSGGHTIICRVSGFDDIEVLGTTIDDAAGEAFDKVAKHYDLGYPGGVVIDRLAKSGNPMAFHFPGSALSKGDHPYDISYSGLKSAVINQLDQFWDGESEKSPENIAASFQRVAVGTLMRRVRLALDDTGLKRISAGGGVAANSLLRSELTALEKGGYEVAFPSLKLCTDNGAMIAALAYKYLQDGVRSDFSESASARVSAFKKSYP